ncbi:MAG: TIGR02922 family protein [Colwellia sp.]|nr:TIGR02922 family protein [Colwellia sp.]
MTDYKEKLVTVIYYSDTSLELLHKIESFLQCPKGRVVIPETFKRGKAIIAVCEGEINIMNKVGDRILAIDEVA